MTVYTTLPTDDLNLAVEVTESNDMVTLNITPASVNVTSAVTSVNGLTGNVTLTTTEITEGVNEYFTDARADARVDLQTGANLDLSFQDTDDLAEGPTNLYSKQPNAITDDVTFNSVSFGTDTTLSWNPTDFTLDMPLDGVTIQLGQETVARVLNKTGATLDDGKVVRVTGAQGNRMTVALADNSSDALSGTILGIMTEPTLNNQQGFTTITGLVRDIDTSAFNDGDVLYLGSAGAITNVQPATPLHLITVGYCVRSHATVGSIFAFPQNGYELDELHDVLITNVQNNDLISWDSANSYWKNITNNYITADSTDTLTNKSGAISQWTNDSAYITATALTPYYTSTQVDALPVSTFTNDAGYSTTTGTVTPSSTDTFTNKSGAISQWTNDSGYLTAETDSQTLSFTSPNLTISNGNSQDLSSLEVAGVDGGTY